MLTTRRCQTVDQAALQHACAGGEHVLLQGAAEDEDSPRAEDSHTSSWSTAPQHQRRLLHLRALCR